MKTNHTDKDIPTKYLLEELSEAERIDFEQQYFEDQDLFEHLLVTEDELIDDYVKGILPKETQERFERYFLTTTKRHQRVEFAKTLLDKIDSGKNTNVKLKEKKWWQIVGELFNSKKLELRWALTTTLFVVFVISFGMYIKRYFVDQQQLVKKQNVPINSQQKKVLEEAKLLKPDLEKPNIEIKNEEKGQSNEKHLSSKLSKKPQVIPVDLDFSTRGIGNSKTLQNLPKRSEVNIKLSINSQTDYEKYMVLLTTVEGKTIWQGMRSTKVAKGKQFVSFRIKSKELRPNDYEITISSFPNGEYTQRYSFSVINSTSK